MRKILIGEGGNARVYRVWREDYKEFAAEKKSRSSLVKEALWLKKLQEFSVPNFYDIRKEKEKWILSMEYLPGSTLEVLLETKRYKKFEYLEIMKAVLIEWKKIHEKFPNLVFCDLKPSNIIVTRKKEIYFIDFGSICIDGEKTQCSGTFPYSAPEIKKGLPEIKSDLYSIAQMIWRTRNWQKDFFYYYLIQPCICKSVKRRKADANSMLRKINAYLFFQHIWGIFQDFFWKIVRYLLLGIGFVILLWYFSKKYDIMNVMKLWE